MSPLGIRRPPRASPLRVRTPRPLLDVLRDGPAPLLAGADPRPARLDAAFVVPPGRWGEATHVHLAALVPALAARGHAVAVVAEDAEPEGALAAAGVRVVTELDALAAIDVAVAVGAEAVPTVLAFPGARARAHLQLDDEGELHGASAARLWAAWALGQGLHRLCASPALAALAGEAGGVTVYEPGIDHDTFKPWPTHRRDDLVLGYVRGGAPWRGAPLALLALEELRRRRPAVEVALFGDERPVAGAPAQRQLGWLEGDALAHAYASATVGLVLSLTAPSAVGVEMLACGLSVVEARGPGTLAAYGEDGPVELCPPDPLALCAGIERLLDDLALRAERARAGMAFAAGRTWERAAEQVEAGLRGALGRAAQG